LVLQFANPNSPSVLLSIVGLKNHLVYVPLMFVIPHILDTRKKLLSFLILFAFVSVFISGLGLYQFTQPYDAWINTTLSHEEGRVVGASSFGDDEGGVFVRTSSTFSFLGGFATFLNITVPFLIALIFSRGLKGWRIYLVYFALIVSIGATFTTGARSTVLIALTSIPFIFLMATLRGLISTTSFFRLTLLGVASLAIVSVAFQDSIAGVIYRTENADSNFGRLLSPFVETFSAFAVSPLMGTGLGTNSNAAATVMGTGYFYWLNGSFFEAETARILQEVGLIGFIFTYVLRVYLVVLAFRYMVRHRDPLYIGLCLACAVFFMVHLILFVVNNPTAGLYYWAMAGMVLATGRLARTDFAEAHGLDERLQPKFSMPQPPATPAFA
jgi:O-antigen ligase